ncbi:MAG: hypothetical protein ACOZAQ_06710 [Pseudomonadota bacterium]
MAESRLVPCNLMAWPKIRNLLPDQKLIVYHLWATCQSAVGCQLLDLWAFQGALSITHEVLMDTLGELANKGIVEVDEETGEVAIADWGRWHKFNTPPRRRLAEDAIKHIQSPRLRKIVEKSMICALREGKGREGKEREGKERKGKESKVNTHKSESAREGGAPARPSSRRGMVENEEGITFNPRDPRDAAILADIRQHAAMEVVRAVKAARNDDPLGRAFPSAVWRQLRRTGEADSLPPWARVVSEYLAPPPSPSGGEGMEGVDAWEDLQAPQALGHQGGEA